MEEDRLIGSLVDGRFRLLSVIGEGGSAVVYKALHIHLEQMVAVKIMHRHLTCNPQAIKRFQNEAKSASLLSHSHICSVLTFGLVAQGQPYIVMELLEGKTLAQELKESQRLELPRFFPIFCQILQALGHAHEKGVIHRDLKPANVMLLNDKEHSDFVKLLDFGIARVLPGGEMPLQHLTDKGEIFGSPFYMSPEQCRGQEAGATADIYSVACLMYESVTGKLPFFGQTVLETLYDHLNEVAEPFAVACPGLPPVPFLERIVFKAMEKEKEKRYQSCLELQADLEEALLPVAPSRVPHWTGSLLRPGLRRFFRKRRDYAFAFIILLAGLLAALFFLGQRPLCLLAFEKGRLMLEEAVEGPQSRGISSSCQRLARLYLACGDNRGAVACLERALRIDAGLLPSDKSKIIEIMSLTGELCLLRDALGDFKGEKDSLLFVRDLLVTNYGNNCSQLLSIYTRLAVLSARERDFSGAEKNYLSAAKVAGYQGLVAEKTEVADRKEQCASYRKARQYYRQAGELANLAHPYGRSCEIIDYQLASAKLAAELDDGKTAESEYLKACALAERVGDASRAKAQGELGMFYVNAGKLGQGIAHLEKSIDLSSRAPGSQSPEAAVSWNQLGDACLSARQFGKAAIALDRAIKLRQLNHMPGIRDAFDHLGLAYMGQHEFPAARAAFEQALSASTLNNRRKVRLSGRASYHLALLYQASGDAARSERYFKQAIEIREKVVRAGKDLDEVREIYGAYRAFLLKQGRRAEAGAIDESSKKLELRLE